MSRSRGLSGGGRGSVRAKRTKVLSLGGLDFSLIPPSFPLHCFYEKRIKYEMCRGATSHRRCRGSCTKHSKTGVFMKTKPQNNDLGGPTPLIYYVEENVVKINKTGM